jgi:putative salt-induced outer membrane protein YdiY
MLKVLFSLTALAFCLQANAISNIESSRPGLPKEGWSGHLEFGFDAETGNKSEEDYRAYAKAVSRHGDNIYLGILQRDYGTTRGIKDTDDGFVHARWVHLLNEKWATEGFIQWEESVFDNLTSRSLIGSNLRYVIAEDDDVFSLSVGLGGFYEREVLDLDTYEQKSNLWRMNSFAVYKHNLNDHVGISATLYYQPSTQNFMDYRSYMTSSLLVKLTSTLDLKLQYQTNRDSMPAKNLEATPPIDNHKVNSRYQTSLVYRF